MYTFFHSHTHSSISYTFSVHYWPCCSKCSKLSFSFKCLFIIVIISYPDTFRMNTCSVCLCVWMDNDVMGNILLSGNTNQTTCDITFHPGSGLWVLIYHLITAMWHVTASRFYDTWNKNLNYDNILMLLVSSFNLSGCQAESFRTPRGRIGKKDVLME